MQERLRSSNLQPWVVRAFDMLALGINFKASHALPVASQPGVHGLLVNGMNCQSSRLVGTGEVYVLLHEATHD